MYWKKRSVFVLIFVVVLMLAACASEADYTMDIPMESSEYAYTEKESFISDGEGAAFVGSSDDADVMRSDITVETAVSAPSQERLIIRTGSLSIVVVDTETAVFQIAQMVEENGGWVVNSNLYKYSDSAKTGDITVRVPSDGYNSAMEAVKGMALDVESESSSGQDVTDEYVDLASRLGNLEATADRVRSFLNETENVEEALAVNVELSRLEGEIEVIKGRMQYLSQSASFSTISVHLTPDELSQPIEVAGWRPQGVAKDAIESLIDALQGLASFLIWFVIYALPLLLIIGVPIWLFVRFVRGRIRRRQRKAESEEVVKDTISTK